MRLAKALGVDPHWLYAGEEGEESTVPLARALLNEEELKRYDQEDLLRLKDDLTAEYEELLPARRTKESFFRPETPEERARMDRFIVASANLGVAQRVLEKTAGPQRA